LSAVVDRLPDGVAVFDADWTIRYANPAAARLLGARTAALAGRNLWVALPELAGSVFHSHLLHARSLGVPVTWRAFYGPTGRWLSATAECVDGLLQVHVKEATEHLVEGPPAAAAGEPAALTDEDADRDRLRFLAEVSESVISSLDTGETATRLAEVAVSQLCDWAVVSIVEEDGQPGEEARAHRDPARRADLDTYLDGQLRGAADMTALVDALLTGQPVQLAPLEQAVVDPSLPTEEVRAAWRRLDSTSCTIVPLRARGETFGALTMVNTGTRRAHTEMEIATAVEVARRGALALDNARLYGRQSKVAATLQHSLLTPPPQPDHLQIAVRYRPATTYQQVGGDWYDAFPQPDGATLLVIGDVVGHDVDAAAAMGQLRSMLRAIAYDRPESPARVLARVDGVLNGLQVDTLATALVARLEQSPAQAAVGLRTLRWSSAGHLPPLLLDADGRIQVLECPPERLLGTDHTGWRTDHEVPLDPGATVLLYTDGIVEHGRRGIDEGIARLTAVLAELGHLPLDDLCDQLLARLATGRTDDDIALLAVRCYSEDGPGH
jgi:serine phosphatase RsbU (regulator of sigma subunit)